MVEMNRRRFLFASTGLTAAGLLAGATFGLPDLLQAAHDRPLAQGSGILVLVTMYGGNDGINTVIPYADKLTFPASWMRTRRDHARFLNLIEVSAFLHQHQRERKGGAIVATVDDYAVAHRLAGQVLVDTLGDLKRNLREAFEQVRALAEKSSGAVSRREIREALSLPDSTVRRWLTELVELEYLEVEASRGGAGLSARYRVSERGPQRDLALGLLSVDELREKL